MTVRDNGKDRETGGYWENQFCAMARSYGKVFTPHQFKRSGAAKFYGPKDGRLKSSWNLPDITIWAAPGEHHEIKQKNMTRDGMYGLEKYRLDALAEFADVTNQRVFYTIHDWERAGASDAHERTANRIHHWLFADVADLRKGCTKQQEGVLTYYNSELEPRLTWYWSGALGRKLSRFHPLADLWGSPVPAQRADRRGEVA